LHPGVVFPGRGRIFGAQGDEAYDLEVLGPPNLTGADGEVRPPRAPSRLPTEPASSEVAQDEEHDEDDDYDDDDGFETHGLCRLLQMGGR
jgi:hypothetical protein